MSKSEDYKLEQSTSIISSTETKLADMPLKSLLFDLSDAKKGVPIGETHVPDLQPKGEGVTAGLQGSDGKDTYLFKFAKTDLLFQPIVEDVFNEALAFRIAIALGFVKNTSDYRLVLAKTGDSANTIQASLLIKFAKNYRPVTDIMAGRDIDNNQAHKKPFHEGLRANEVVLPQIGKYNFFMALMQDPDAMHKDCKNKGIVNNDLFILDSGFKPTPRFPIAFQADGSFTSAYYKYNFQSPFALGFIYRHHAFRNFSLLDDAPLIDKLAGIHNGIIRQQQILSAMDDFKIELNALLQEAKPNKTLYEKIENHIAEIDNYKEIVKERIKSIEKPFIHYLALYESKDDINHQLLKSVIAFEELLSESSMYSREGVPLCAPQFEKRFFALPMTEKAGKITFDISKAPKNFLQLIAALNIPFETNNKNRTITFNTEQFKSQVTPDRVRLITHPETVGLGVAMEHKDIEIKSYLSDFTALTSRLANEPLREILDSKYQQYNENKKISTNPQAQIKILKEMFKVVSKYVPTNLLSANHFDASGNFGSLVQLQAKIVSEQQRILVKILSKHEPFILLLDGKSIGDLFSRIDLLDISAVAVNFFDTALKNQASIQHPLFKEIIKLIISAPVGYYTSAKIHEKMQQFIQQQTKELRKSTTTTPVASEVRPLSHTLVIPPILAEPVTKPHRGSDSDAAKALVGTGSSGVFADSRKPTPTSSDPTSKAEQTFS